MQLYTYYRSSAAYRVRIALHLKGLDYTAVPVHLTRNGGEQLSDAYRALNPNEAVPTLQDGALTLSQSLAIIEYLDETHPEPPLLPGTPADRARIRSIAQTIACDIHPIDNLRVLQYLTGTLGFTEAQKSAWYCHWVERGLAAVERMLTDDPRPGAFCHGDAPTLADCCLAWIFHESLNRGRLSSWWAGSRFVAASGCAHGWFSPMQGVPPPCPRCSSTCRGQHFSQLKGPGRGRR